jgi:hypothetical protein
LEWIFHHALLVSANFFTAPTTQESSAPRVAFGCAHWEINFASKVLFSRLSKFRLEPEIGREIDCGSRMNNGSGVAFSSFPMYTFICIALLKFKCRSLPTVPAPKKRVREQKRRENIHGQRRRCQKTTLNWAKLVREQRERGQKKRA